MKSTQLYDFTLAANGSQVILADANFYKVLTSTGDLKITRDGGSTVRPMRAGRGEREVDFQRLTVTDISGAPNSGTIVVGDSNFIDDTIVLSSAINVRPESATGSYSASSALAAATAEQVFSPASNTAGAMILSADGWGYEGTNMAAAFIHKSSAPASITDGAMIAGSHTTYNNATTLAWGIRMPKEQFVPAGQGLYFITIGFGITLNQNFRACRYKLL